MKKLSTILFITLILSVSGFFAQGVVNGKAISLVRPDYSPAAKAIGAEGAVNVRVLIDEQGNVMTAEAVSGHSLLRKTSEAAALASKFEPTFVSGKAVRVNGIVVYNFVADRQNTVPKPIEDFSRFGDVLNAKALKLPAPHYPAAARAIKAEGTVIVAVKINEQGNVIIAKALDGHPLLLKEAEKAALKAKFEPTVIDEGAVTTKGIVVYQFTWHQ